MVLCVGFVLTSYMLLQVPSRARGCRDRLHHRRPWSVHSLGSRVWGLGSRVEGRGSRVEGQGSRV
eukprot:3716928-Rhodomonas_salina.1